jgi:hypothetical protein
MVSCNSSTAEPADFNRSFQRLMAKQASSYQMPMAKTGKRVIIDHCAAPIARERKPGGRHVCR